MECKDKINTKNDGDRRPSTPAVIITSYDFWKYLQTGRHASYGQYSKAAAFFSLIERQHYTDMASPDTPLMTSYNRLAEQWRWHRNTVRSFLADLQDLGMLTIDVKPQGLNINFTAYRRQNSAACGGSIEQPRGKPPG